jgi:hypothetical protein
MRCLIGFLEVTKVFGGFAAGHFLYLVKAINVTLGYFSRKNLILLVK